MSGLQVKQRDGVFYAVGTVSGQRIRRSLGTRDRKVAEELRAQYEAKLWKAATYGEAAVRTFDDAALSYLQTGKDPRFTASIIRHFKGRALTSIKPGDLVDAALKLYPKGAPATRNRQAIVPAKAIINHAAERGWCSRISAKLFRVEKSTKHKPVDRAWLDAFIAEADKAKLPHLSGIVLFMHQTGARVAEAVRLQGQDVDLQQRFAVLVRTKTEENSVRALTAELAARIAALGLKDGEPVFSYTDPKAVTRRMRAVAKRAKIAIRTSHSAGRHSFGTNAMSAGARIKDAMEAGGWKSAALFIKTYVHTQEAGRTIAGLFDREAGPLDTNLAQGLKRRRSRFGKQSRK